MAFGPEGTFTVLERDRAVRAGRIGGRSRSRAKVKAAKSNGKRGGRPTTSTLLERILKRNVTPEEWLVFRAKVLPHVLAGEQQIVTKYFQAEWMEIPTVSWRGLPTQVRQAIRHIKAVAKIYPWRPRTQPPKDYVVIRVEKHPHEKKLWERRHPNMPFVMTRPKKIPITSIPYYAYFNSLFIRHPRLTEEEIQQGGGSRMTREVAKALLKHLRFKHAKP